MRREEVITYLLEGAAARSEAFRRVEGLKSEILKSKRSSVTELGTVSFVGASKFSGQSYAARAKQEAGSTQATGVGRFGAICCGKIAIYADLGSEVVRAGPKEFTLIENIQIGGRARKHVA